MIFRIYDLSDIHLFNVTLEKASNGQKEHNHAILKFLINESSHACQVHFVRYQEVHIRFMSACVELKYILLFRSNFMLPL